MKKVFIASFMYAPKQTGKAGGNVPESTTPETDQANENKQDGKTADSGEKEADKEADKPDAPAPKPEPTSEKLTEIRGKIDESLVAIATETDRKKKLDIVLELQKLQAAEQAEINAIKKAELDAVVLEKRNARIALIDAVLDAKEAELRFLIGEYLTAAEVNVIKQDGTTVSQKPQELIEKMNALTEITKNAREKVVNELLAKFPGGSTSNSVATGSIAAGGSKGDTAKKIIERYEAHLAEGKNDTDARKAVIAEGFSRGTTGAAVLAYRKEKGLTD